MGRSAGRQVGRWAGRQIGRSADRQIGRSTDGQNGRRKFASARICQVMPKSSSSGKRLVSPEQASAKLMPCCQNRKSW